VNGITFREDFGCWWPDYDHAPEKCFALVKRNLSDCRVATSLCKKRGVCVQAGGHAGFWPMELSKYFVDVRTLEPEPALFECMVRNLGLPDSKMGRSPRTHDGITVRRAALGAEVGQVMMRPHCSAGSWSVADDGTIPVEQVTIDSLNLSACDAIFLDVEGYERESLRGALLTIMKFKPVLHVEMLPRSADMIRAYVQSLGYARHSRVHKDEIFVPR